jgi:FtsZ-binding cell division protein ZapB
LEREKVLEQFGQLENRIENLISSVKRLEAENVELKNKNQELGTQLQAKIMAERENDEVKGLIRSKIDSLMGKLDEFTEE